jgi:hypothetical protein
LSAQSSRTRGPLGRIALGGVDRLIPQGGDLPEARHTLLQELEQLPTHFGLVEEEAGQVSARSRDACDPPTGDRIGLIVERDDDRHRAARLAGRTGCVGVRRDHSVHLKRGQLAGEGWQTVELPVRIPDLNAHVAWVHVTGFPQAGQKCANGSPVGGVGGHARPE